MTVETREWTDQRERTDAGWGTPGSGPGPGPGPGTGSSDAPVTWRELTWEELLVEADRIGPDARFATWSDEEVVDRLSVGAAELEAAFCRWLELLAELVVRRVWADQGARTPAAWSSWKLGIAPSTAREQVRVALQLRDYPRVRDRFAAGTLSYSKVRAITRCGRPSCEELLLEWADDATAQQLERIARGFRTAERSRHEAAQLDDGDPLLRCEVRSRAVGVDRREVRIVGPADRIVAIEDTLRRLGGELDRETLVLHAHHVVHWADGGRTDLDNLVLLCGFHHRFVHRRGWHIEVRRDGRHRYRPGPTRPAVPRVGRPPGGRAVAVSGAAPPTASAEALQPPTHLGGPYDLDTAVAVLQHRHAAERAGAGPPATAG